MRALFTLCLLGMFLAVPGWGASRPLRHAPKKKPKPSIPTFTQPSLERVDRPRPKRGIAETPEGRISRYRFNSMMGIHVADGSGFVIGGQFGFIVGKQVPFYAGPEMNFTLFSKGNLFESLGGAWYEISLGSPTLRLHTGLLAGIALAKDLPSFPEIGYAAYLDASIAEEIDELASIRGQFRPGYSGGRFAFMMNFSVGFRFY